MAMERSMQSRSKAIGIMDDYGYEYIGMVQYNIGTAICLLRMYAMPFERFVLR